MKICTSCDAVFDSGDWRCPSCGMQPDREDSIPVLAPASNLVDEGFKPEFFEKLFNLEATNFWFRVRNQIIVWSLKKYFPRPETFLEIGCGTGFVLAEIESQFPHTRVSGSEIHVTGLKLALRRLDRACVWQMDARQIPFENEFDVVGAFDVLEHIEADEQVLAQIYKALRPGGGIVLTVPQHPWLWSAADEQAGHERRYTADGLKAKVTNAGFTITRTSSFVSFLLPFMLVSRLGSRRAGNNHDPFREFKINRLVNWSFEIVMKFEAALIRAGISLPIGGSLLMLAQKPTSQ